MASIPAVATLLIIGTFREGPGIGLTTAHFDAATGTLTQPVLAAETPVPSFLTVAPDGRHVHVCNETWPGRLTTFAIDPADASLTPVANVSSEGKSPCSIELDRLGRHALVANYSDGVFSVFALDDGRLGVRTARVEIAGSSVRADRQEASHAHCFVTDPGNRFALGVDLGADRVHVFRFDAGSGELTPHEPASFAARPGAGPRHLRFHPDGRHAYIVNELDLTVSACTWDGERGVLAEFQHVSSRPDGHTTADTSAELMVHPAGRFLYVSNRGANEIAVFAIDPRTRAPTLLEQVSSRGGRPRNMVIDPTGLWLLVANQDGDGIAIFAIDPGTGRLTAHGDPVPVKNPGCLRFAPRPARP